MSESEPIQHTPEHVELSRGELFTIDLERINTEIITLLADPTVEPTVLREAWAMRATIAEAFIETLEPTVDNPKLRERVQFDMMVDKASIFEQAGDTLRYAKELDTAEGFAIQQNFDDILDSLTQELNEKTAELDDSPDALVIKLRGHVSFQNREYLRDLIYDGIDTEDLLGTVYGMILDEGGDPVEVLASIVLRSS